MEGKFQIDPSVFTWHENNSFIGVIIDGFLFSGNEKFQNAVIANLRQMLISSVI